MQTNNKWTELIENMKYHISKFENGYDYFNDGKGNLSKLHIEEIKESAAKLAKFYHINPQGDDRPHKYLTIPKIGLDVDEVLADWLPAWMEKFNIKNVPTTWFFDHQIKERFEELRKKNELDEFFLNLKPRINPIEIPFEPHCYITSRPVNSEITRQWLDRNGFPMRPVHTVEVNKTKVEIAQQAGVDWFVDDGYHNFIELNRAGVCCFLWDTPHNRKYEVGYKRIKSFNELVY